jgi:hypothetical protein
MIILLVYKKLYYKCSLYTILKIYIYQGKYLMKKLIIVSFAVTSLFADIKTTQNSLEYQWFSSAIAQDNSQGDDDDGGDNEGEGVEVIEIIGIRPDDGEEGDGGGGGGLNLDLGGGSGGGGSGSGGSGGSGSSGDGSSDSSGDNGEGEEDSESTPRQQCLNHNQGVRRRFARCNATHSGNHVEAITNVCLGGGTLSIGVNGALITGNVSVDFYTQCKDLEDRKLRNALDGCIVIKEDSTRICPGD